MGEVWKARDTRLGRIVAIKCLKSPHGERFKQEARAIAALNHPHICQIFDIGPDYLVLEYIDGKPLQGPLPVEEAVGLALQISSALAEAHRRGIIHRDLKPANVLVTEGGSAKLLDFGLATLGTDEDPDATRTIEGTVMGTPAYMAPEQVQGKALDERSDVFCFGALLYEILAGSRAFGGHSNAEVWSSVLRDEPGPLKAPDRINLIVRQCLAKDPAKRFQTMVEVRAALEQVSVRFAPQQTRASHLPTGVTRLIGRRRELRELQDLLLRDDVKLLSLTGPAGIGKTRLAIEVSHAAVKVFEHVWFVELEGVMEPHRVPSAILHGVGMRDEDTRPPLSCLAEYLESRNGLLVLDNFEQVADAAPLLAQLLISCPQLKILVTSRVLLHLRAEHEYIVQPLVSVGGDADLDLPDAIALFLERAPGIKPTADVVRFIGEICARLDGLPLAIELAAARSKLLSPQAMLGRLKDRFQWLGGGPRDLPERQQTLRHAIDWSYDLLAPAEKALLQHLSVFEGGATIDAVEAVCTGEGDPLDLLSALADKSLLLQQEDHNGKVRVRMLETIREYARERLNKEGDAARVRARHAAYYLALAEATHGKKADFPRIQHHDLLEEDHGNCIAALDSFLRDGNAELALRMGVALWPFWEARGHWTGGREQLQRLLSETTGAGLPSARGKALYAAGVLADAQGDYSAAREAFEEHLEIQRAAPSPAALAAAMNNLGIVALRQGDYEAARIAYLEALDILRSLDSPLSVAQCLNNLGHVAMAKGNYTTARSNYQESLAICRRSKSTCDMAWTLSNLGDVAREESHLDEAETLYSQALALFRQVKDQGGLANCMADLANLAVMRGHYPTAAQLYQEGLVIFGDQGDRRGIARVLDGFATMALARGNPEAALRLWGAVSTVRNNLGLQQSREQRLRLDANVAAARALLSSDAQSVWTAGELMPVEKAITYALTTALL